MKKRTSAHYEDMLDEHPAAAVGVRLAAEAVFAALRGAYAGSADPVYRALVRRLQSAYGEALTADEVRREMRAVAGSADPGRPPLYDEPVRPRTITVTDWHWKRAKEIGDGEGASSGIRRALEAYQED